MPAKHYLEMKELQSDQDILDAIPPVFIRVVVNGKADAIAKRPLFLQHFAALDHRDTHHTCNHPGNSCSEEEI